MPHQEQIILIADDDCDDREMTRDALSDNDFKNPLHCVADGEELLDYLLHRGAYADFSSAPRPALILLDLNMPRMNGREALREIKSDPSLRQIPIIVLTTSRQEEDIFESYDLGASSFISKPTSYEALVQTMKNVGTYWTSIVSLPAGSSGGAHAR